MPDVEAYIVRGAKMRCQCGTHARKINLPVSHGTYFRDKPMMNQGDYTQENVSTFGICASSTNPSSETIYLVGEDGKEVQGKPCLPQITNGWNPVKEDTIVGEQSALTNTSQLVCMNGGCIYFETTGQEEE